MEKLKTERKKKVIRYIKATIIAAIVIGVLYVASWVFSLYPQAFLYLILAVMVSVFIWVVTKVLEERERED